MAQDATQGQQAYMRAIEEYIGRHETRGSDGPKDLATMQQMGAQNFYQGKIQII